MTPSDLVCVDESISRWCGLGGDWIDVGLPHYLAMDRKPENGWEIEDATCGRSGIILRLEIVAAIDETREKDFEDSMQHSAAVAGRFIDSWISVGMRFIGILKNATRKFPMRFLR